MNPGILHAPDWARTALGTPIGLFRKKHSESAPVVFIGGVHGDEPEGLRLAGDLLRWLQDAETRGEVKRSWILVPDINPDGSARKQRTNGRGVDLNRNFPSADWSPEKKAERYNPGPSPASEPEIQALCALLVAEKPQAIVHFHSWEPCVVYTGEGARPWAEACGEGTGYEVREDIGYPTPGSLGQYGALELRTPVVCIEARDGEDPAGLWPRFGPGLRRILKGERP